MFKKLLRKFLGIDLLENKLKFYEQTINNFKDLIQVGVDVHVKSNSWAVICVGGKKEYITFHLLHTDELEDLKRFLQHFKKENIIMDTLTFINKEWLFR